MLKGFIRQASLTDTVSIAKDLREADKAEIKAHSGIDPVVTLDHARRSGDRVRVVCLPNGVPAAIYGVNPTSVEGLGSVWMVATNQFHLLHRQFLRECREEIEDLGQGYRALFNYTDARNTVHHRWIKWAGFTFIKRHERFGVEGRPFLEFVKIMEDRDV